MKYVEIEENKGDLLRYVMGDAGLDEEKREACADFITTAPGRLVCYELSGVDQETGGFGSTCMVIADAEPGGVRQSCVVA